MTIAPPEILKVNKKEIACDGGGPLGHPKVYLNLGEEGRVECPYCDRLFIFDDGAHETEENA